MGRDGVHTVSTCFYSSSKDSAEGSVVPSNTMTISPLISFLEKCSITSAKVPRAFSSWILVSSRETQTFL